MASRAQRITSLASTILHHKECYYRGEPEVSDAEYDRLEDELRALSPNHPVLSAVGTSTGGDLPKVSHRVPMLSLAKTYDVKELLRWMDGRPVVGTYKVDGNSLSLEYLDGKLVLAKTRGSGQIGEEVTDKIRWVADCVAQLPTDSAQETEIRGELFCDDEQFGHLVKEMLRLGLERPTSPRNIVSGILGRKQHLELARFFRFQAFDVLTFPDSDRRFSTEHQKFEWLTAAGFSVPEWRLIHQAQDIEPFLRQTKSFMTEGDIGLDGAVFSYDDCTLQRELGSTSHHPRYRMSFKWQGQTATASIVEVTWSTSRLGMVTPVAVIEPVYLSGANISNITLHNAAHVSNYNLKPGDQIEIVRSGEVIPKFLRVTKENPGTYSFPKACPSCGERLVFDDVRLVCRNHAGCPAQQIRTILNWIRCAGIDDLSEKRLWPLIEHGLVTHMSDLYRLSFDQLIEMPLTKEKLARKLLANIAGSKQLPLTQFLNGLGIQGSGPTTWQVIVEHFGSLERIRSLSIEDLSDVHGFAETMAGQIVDGLGKRSEDIERLLAAGVEPQTMESVETVTDGLAGKSFVLTGTMSRPRAAIESLIKDHGGKTSSSVSKATFALVIADPSSKSSKAKKARELGVRLLSEAELYALIDSEND